MAQIVSFLSDTVTKKTTLERPACLGSAPVASSRAPAAQGTNAAAASSVTSAINAPVASSAARTDAGATVTPSAATDLAQWMFLAIGCAPQMCEVAEHTTTVSAPVLVSCSAVHFVFTGRQVDKADDVEDACLFGSGHDRTAARSATSSCTCARKSICEGSCNLSCTNCRLR